MSTDNRMQLLKYAYDGVARDWVDLRDNIYKPSLNTLGAGINPSQSLFSIQGKGDQHDRKLKFGVRQQGETGRCVGYALAALIDVQRRLQTGDALQLPDLECASADMLYHMARFHDQFTQLNNADRRIRSRKRMTLYCWNRAARESGPCVLS